MVPHPSTFGVGEGLASLLVHGPFATEGERALVVGRYDAARSVALGGDVAAGELVSASWVWDPFTVGTPHPRPVAAALSRAFPGSDVQIVEQALTVTDADRGLADLLAALGVPREAVDVLELPMEELLQCSEGVGLGSRRDVARQLTASGARPQRPERPARPERPQRPRGPVLRGADRALGLTTSVLGALMILVALALFVLGVALEGEGLLPRNPWGLLVLGLALSYLGWRQHRRGTA